MHAFECAGVRVFEDVAMLVSKMERLEAHLSLVLSSSLVKEEATSASRSYLNLGSSSGWARVKLDLWYIQAHPII